MFCLLQPGVFCVHACVFVCVFLTPYWSNKKPLNTITAAIPSSVWRHEVSRRHRDPAQQAVCRIKPGLEHLPSCVVTDLVLTQTVEASDNSLSRHFLCRLRICWSSWRIKTNSWLDWGKESRAFKPTPATPTRPWPHWRRHCPKRYRQVTEPPYLKGDTHQPLCSRLHEFSHESLQFAAKLSDSKEAIQELTEIKVKGEQGTGLVHVCDPAQWMQGGVHLS